MAAHTQWGHTVEVHERLHILIHKKKVLRLTVLLNVEWKLCFQREISDEVLKKC